MLVDLYFSRDKKIRYHITTCSCWSDDDQAGLYYKDIVAIVGAIAINATGDSSGINEWLLPFMKQKDIKSITFHYLEDEIHHCEIWQDNISQLGSFMPTSVYINAETVEDIISQLPAIIDKVTLVYIECNPLSAESIANALRRKYKDTNRIYFLFNPARNATKIENTAAASATAYFN